jgi:two-component system chemotaxis sensor kinase CheA
MQDSLMILDDPELIQDFVIESQEHLADVEGQLLTLEESGGSIDLPLVNKVFRAIHSLKGAAGFLGFKTLETLAHRGEEVLDRLRNETIRPTKEVINTLLKATDRLKTLIDSIQSSNEQDVSENVRALEQLMKDAAHSGMSNDSPSQAALEKHAESTSEGSAAIDVLASGDATSETMREAVRDFLVESHDSLAQIESEMVLLEKEPDSATIINNVFRSVHTIKGTAGFLAFRQIEKLTHAGENILGAIRNNQLGFDSQICTELLSMVDALKQYLATVESTGTDGNKSCESQVHRMEKLLDQLLTEQGNTHLKSMTIPTKQPMELSASNKTPIVPANKTTAASPNADGNIQPAPPIVSKLDSHSGLSIDSTIRVDVAILDKLMTRVGELVLARNQVMQLSNQLGSSDLQRTSQRINLITTELQEGVMKTRMQQIGNVWSKFPRMVRDLAAVCGKEIRIEMEGKETELDKTIIESIKDPLTHLVRNTVDHGIEKPSVRVANGKPAEGCLTLRAFHEGGQVNIEISDDGSGLNLKRIEEKAIEKNLISPDVAARLTEREIAELIFLPGFSTAETVSNVSGRGVGMDVVKTNIEKIGGTVDLQTVSGIGTTIKIKIPLTLAIIPALVVTNDGNRFAIPQVNLLELVRLESEKTTEKIEWIQGAPVYRLRGQLLPLVYLKKVLNTKASSNPFTDNVNIVVLRADDRQFGLVVDRINDTEEIVVKPLSSQLKNVSVYSGATIMGDGKVALILDVLGIAQKANLILKDRSRSVQESSGHVKEHGGESQNLLLLATCTNRRLAIPISEVARLEKIPVDTIEIAENREVVQYRGEILPMIRLATVLGITDETTPVDGLLNVIVYNQDAQSYGLIVNQIVDIIEISIEVQKQSHRRGFLGSAIIQDHVTDFVNLPAIIDQLESLPQSYPTLSI